MIPNQGYGQSVAYGGSSYGQTGQAGSSYGNPYGSGSSYGQTYGSGSSYGQPSSYGQYGSSYSSQAGYGQANGNPYSSGSSYGQNQQEYNPNQRYGGYRSLEEENKERDNTEDLKEAAEIPRSLEASKGKEKDADAESPVV
jgi:hypothetical protein